MTDPSDDFAGNLADIPGSPADGRHTLAVIGAVDPALLDLVDLALAGQDAVVIRAGLHFGADDEAESSEAGDAGDDDLVRLVSHSSADGFDDDPVRLDVPMPYTCPTCSLREVLLAVAEDRAAQDPGGTTVILLPAAIELAHLLPGLAEELAGTGVTATALCPGLVHTGFHAAAGIDETQWKDLLWLDAERVVSDGLTAVRRGQVICTPSLRYRSANAILRLAPRWLVRRMASEPERSGRGRD